MRKRILLLALAGLAIGTAAALFVFREDLPFLDWGDPVFTAEIPEDRPRRLDRRELARFSGQNMDQILDALKAENAKEEDGGGSLSPVDTTTGKQLLSSLPDAPLPFPDSAEPRDEKWLRDYVTSMKKEEATEPTDEELWQFNLALSALKISPDQLPESLRRNTQPGRESDTLQVQFTSREIELNGPFAVGNFDGDPLPEIIDQGGGRMSKFPASGSPVPIDNHSLRYPGNGLYHSDYDADGDLDLYVTRGDGYPDSLLRNNGKGGFEDVTIETGLLAFRDTRSAAWIDYDSDGLVDLMVGSRDHPLELYHQTEGGSFQPVAWDLRLWVPRGVDGIEVADVDGDGYADFFLEIGELPNRLCRNTPAAEWSEWRFTDIVAEADLGPAAGGGLTFVDFNSDGKSDLFVHPEDGRPHLFLNRGELDFRDVTEDIGLPEISGVTAVGAVDMDNDGFLDLVLGTGELRINRVLWNRGGLAFREISVASGLSYLDRPVQFYGSDLDQNGASDLVYRNADGEIRFLEATGDLQSWTRIRLSETAPGARVSLVVRDKDWVLHPIERIAGPKTEFTVGLGEAEIIESVKVYFPGEEAPVTELEKIEPNQLLEIDLPKRPKKRATVPLG